MKRFRLTKTAKILIVIIVILAIVGGAFAAIKTGFVKTGKDKDTVKVETSIDKNETSGNNNVNTGTSESDINNTDTNTDDATINLSLDEWIGWKSILDSQAKGYYEAEGIKVNINVINDATQSSNALIKGDLNAAGYTINRTAFLSNKFTEAGVDVIMPFITNYSNGGDGIIAKSSIQSINDLVNAKIAVPEFSEAETLLAWFVDKSDLSQEDKDKIMDNLILFATADDTAKAFFAGQVDVAATWEPYLSQAQSMTDAHVLFSTASSSSLVMDGIVFRKDFAEAHPDVIQKFIRATLKASDLYATEFDAIREVMPMFSTSTDEEIIANTENARLTTWKDNKDLLNGTARTIYTDMCDIWESLGETVNREAVDAIFDDSYIEAIADDFDSIETSVDTNGTVVTEENKQEVLDTQALLSKSASVNFIINTSKFSDPTAASQALDEFIDIAKVLDGAIIEIAGNTDPNPTSDPEDTYNKMLSEQRAETVKKYFVMNGIDANRIITVGNGSSNPVAPNDTEENKALNRRTDVSFKIIEQ